MFLPLRTRGIAVLLYLATVALPTLVRADDPKSIACNFGAGAALVYSNGAFKAEPASPIAFDIVDIDAAKQTAVQRDPRGDGPLRVVRAVNALHFLQVVGEGYLNITTVYDKDTTRNAHPAVHSRHFGILGDAVVSQYQGFCTTK